MKSSFKLVENAPRTYEGSFRFGKITPCDDGPTMKAGFKADFTTKLLQVWFITKDLNQQAPEMGVWVKTAAILLKSQVDQQLMVIADETENYGGDIRQAMCSLGYTFLASPCMEG